jgi:hypothetical protein
LQDALDILLIPPRAVAMETNAPSLARKVSLRRSYLLIVHRQRVQTIGKSGVRRRGI